MHSHGAVVVSLVVPNIPDSVCVPRDSLRTSSMCFVKFRHLFSNSSARWLVVFVWLICVRTHGICRSPTCLKVMHACAHMMEQGMQSLRCLTWINNIWHITVMHQLLNESNKTSWGRLSRGNDTPNLELLILQKAYSFRNTMVLKLEVFFAEKN